jgi:predicted transposase YbfD/YdcC
MILIQSLKQISDPRKRYGKRYPLWWLLWLSILGTLCGYYGYRPLADFCREHWQKLQTLVSEDVPSTIPSYSTFRRLYQRLDPQNLALIFHQWCQMVKFDDDLESAPSLPQGAERPESEAEAVESLPLLEEVGDGGSAQEAATFEPAAGGEAQTLPHPESVSQGSPTAGNLTPAKPLEWISGDGKSIRCTRTPDGGNFASTISLFHHRTGTVLGFKLIENAQMSEIHVIRQMLAQWQGEAEAVFMFDALHCQKETVRLIVEHHHHYLIVVKGNQKELFSTLSEWVKHATPLSVDQQPEDTTHGRRVTRKVVVYDAPPTLSQTWANIQRVVVIERWGERDGKSFHSQTLYISDLAHTAEEFQPHIREHWGIENRLHWVRDVTFAEDYPPRTGGYAPTNWAVMNSWMIAVVRCFGYRTLPQGIRALTNQVDKLFEILTQGFSLKT